MFGLDDKTIKLSDKITLINDFSNDVFVDVDYVKGLVDKLSDDDLLDLAKHINSIINFG